MNVKTAKRCTALSFILITLYFFVVLFNPSVSTLISRVFIKNMGRVYVVGGYLPEEVILGIAFLIPTAVLLLYAKKEKNALLTRTSVASLIAGLLFSVVSAVKWIVGIVTNIYDMYLLKKYMLITVPIDQMDTLQERYALYYETFGKFTDVTDKITTVCIIISCVIAVAVFVMFCISVSRSENKRLQFQGELIKPVVSVLILTPQALFGLRYFVLQLVAGFLSEDVRYRFIDTVTTVYSWALYLTVFVCVLFILIFGVILKKKPSVSEQVPEPAPQQE